VGEGVGVTLAQKEVRLRQKHLVPAPRRKMHWGLPLGIACEGVRARLEEKGSRSDPRGVALGLGVRGEGGRR
jgi:hypothetical protein